MIVKLSRVHISVIHTELICKSWISQVFWVKFVFWALRFLNNLVWLFDWVSIKTFWVSREHVNCLEPMQPSGLRVLPQERRVTEQGQAALTHVKHSVSILACSPFLQYTLNASGSHSYTHRCICAGRLYEYIQWPPQAIPSVLVILYIPRLVLQWWTWIEAINLECCGWNCPSLSLHWLSWTSASYCLFGHTHVVYDKLLKHPATRCFTVAVAILIASYFASVCLRSTQI